MKYKDANGTILGYTQAGVKETQESAEALEYDCDVLIPAAAEQAINKYNVANIKAKIIGEAANGPITPFADDALLKKVMIKLGILSKITCLLHDCRAPLSFQIFC